MWVARQADDSFVCFGTKPDKGIFGLEISAWPEEVTGREKRVGWEKELTELATGTDRCGPLRTQ